MGSNLSTLRRMVCIGLMLFTAAVFAKSSIKRNSVLKKVIVDAVAVGSVNRALEDLRSAGFQTISIRGQLISGILSEQALSTANEFSSVNQVRVSRNIMAAGLVTSEGDIAARSNIAREQYNVDGSNIKVAVISDSYNCLGGEAADRLNGDLPSQITVVEEAELCPGLSDEGRALMHVVRDVAPGAELLFLSGANGYASTANGILRLANEYDVDIIVDDAKALSAPFFQRGAITQAAEQAVRQGVVYITAAGNSARLSYESGYRQAVNLNLNLNAHDFDPGPATDIYQRFTLPEGAGISLMLQWDAPAFSVTGTLGSDSDLDIYLLNGRDASILAESTYGNMGRDPIEFLEFFNPEGSGQTEFDLMITKVTGRSPSLMKYILFNRFDGEFLEYATDSSSLFGHANSEKVITVGAGNYRETPAFGATEPLLEFFSSAGGTPWLFDQTGARVPHRQVPEKPNLIAPDNVNTPFFEGEDTDGDGQPNFRGTSAAAPHAAGVAALMLETNPELKPQDIMNIMELTAVDVTMRNNDARTVVGEDFDFDSGFGLIDGYAAVSMAAGYTASASTATPVSSQSEVVVHRPASGGAVFLLLLPLIARAGFSLHRSSCRSTG